MSTRLAVIENWKMIRAGIIKSYWNFYTLLVGLQNITATVENLAAPQKIKYQIIIRLSNSTLRCITHIC
jgi:hypothetical protein